MTVPSSGFTAMPLLPTARQFPQDPGILEYQLSKSWYDTASAINMRTIGIFETLQTTTGNRWVNLSNPSDRRQSYRAALFIPALPNASTLAVNLPETLIAGATCVAIYGVANKVNDHALPLPYVNLATPSDGIQIFVNLGSSQVGIVTTTANWTSYNAYIVVEYLLN